MSLSLTPYKGSYVWDMGTTWTEPDQRDGAAWQHSQRIALLDNKTGAREVDTLETIPRHSIVNVHQVETEFEVEQIRAFIDEMSGRAKTFWVPGYRSMATLAYDQTNILSQHLYIRDIGLRTQHAIGTARQHMYLLRRDLGAGYPKPMTGVQSLNPAFDYEDISMGTTLGTPQYVAYTSVMPLFLCRLEADVVKIEWLSRRLARFTLPMIEVPMEAPYP